MQRRRYIYRCFCGGVRLDHLRIRPDSEFEPDSTESSALVRLCNCSRALASRTFPVLWPTTTSKNKKQTASQPIRPIDPVYSFFLFTLHSFCFFSFAFFLLYNTSHRAGHLLTANISRADDRRAASLIGVIALVCSKARKRLCGQCQVRQSSADANRRKQGAGHREAKQEYHWRCPKISHAFLWEPPPHSSRSVRREPTKGPRDSFSVGRVSPPPSPALPTAHSTLPPSSRALYPPHQPPARNATPRRIHPPSPVPSHCRSSLLSALHSYRLPLASIRSPGPPRWKRSRSKA